jgi:hypothetical protein
MATIQRRWPRRGYAAALGLFVCLGAVALPADAQECRGTKQLYQGQCRYPDEIAQLKAEQARKAADAKRQQEEAGRRAEEEKRKADEEAKRKAEEEQRRAEEQKRLQEQQATQPPPIEPTAAPPPTAPAGPVAPSPAMPSPPAPSAPTAPVEAPDDGEGPGISPLVWVGFGVAGAGVIVGAITGGISMSQASGLKDECPNDICSADRKSDIATMLAIGHAATASLVIAGVGAIVGVVGLVIPGGDDQPAETARLRAVVGPGTIGVMGAF